MERRTKTVRVNMQTDVTAFGPGYYVTDRATLGLQGDWWPAEVVLTGRDGPNLRLTMTTEGRTPDDDSLARAYESSDGTVMLHIMLREIE